MPLRNVGYDVSLYSEGKEMQMYKEEVVDYRTIMCYVASEEGKVRTCFLHRLPSPTFKL